MAVLTAARRKALPKKAFALPGKDGYPIQDKAHARNALSRVSQHGSGSEKARVRAAVHRRYPSIGKGERGKGARTNAFDRPGHREHGNMDWAFGGQKGA